MVAVTGKTLLLRLSVRKLSERENLTIFPIMFQSRINTQQSDTQIGYFLRVIC